MISVTDLTGYLYCPRKLYFGKVLGIKEKPKELTIKGKIKHAVFEDAGREDKTLLSSLTEKDTIESLERKYKTLYYKVLMFHVLHAKKEIEEQGLNPLEIYRELWPFFLKEAQEKSITFYNLAQEKKVYGEELWLAVPKGIPELKIVSQALGVVGVIDRVDIDRGYLPIEIKTGKAPQDGVWREHMIQVGTYMLLLSEYYGMEIKEGYVEYRTVNEQRRVMMNPFLKEEILELIQRVQEMLNRKDLPQKITDRRKCEACGIREVCYSQKYA